MAEDMKTCTKCGSEKPLDSFSRDKRRKDGRQSHCKACKAAWRAANREHCAAYNTAWRQAHPEYDAERYAANRETVRSRSAAWRQANPEYGAEYRAAKPHVGWESRARQRAHRYGHDITVKSFTREQLIDRYGDQCWHCGGDFEELDHHPAPISRGGEHIIDNCKPSCASCNQKSWRNDSEAA